MCGSGAVVCSLFLLIRWAQRARCQAETPLIVLCRFPQPALSFVDNWRTPHTKDLHTVERWKIIDGGKAIEATVMVDDPHAFNAPWSGLVRWTKMNGPLMESVCAENNENYGKFLGLREYPMPEAKTPDF